VISLVKSKRFKKTAKDKGLRKYSIRLRRILYNGLFQGYPLVSSVEVDNEDCIRLWRAVIDQHLKDLIHHHMIKRNWTQYYAARVFIDEQLSGKGNECHLAFLDPKKVYTIFMQFEKLCKFLRSKDIQL